MEIAIRLLEAGAIFYIIMIAVTAFSSWLKPEVISAYRPFFAFAASVAYPVIAFVRRVFPVNVGRADFSPVVAIVLVEAVKLIIVFFIKHFARQGL